MRWRTHLEKPDTTAEVFTALIAVRDDDGSTFLMEGIFNWKDGAWRDENNRLRLLSEPEFWWLPEEELLEAVDDDRKRIEIRAAAAHRRARGA